MQASKHLDIAVGIDIHIIQPPGPVPPLPIPHPFSGLLFDPEDYVMAILEVTGLETALGKVAEVVSSVAKKLPDIGVSELLDELNKELESVGINFFSFATTWVSHLPRARAGTIGNNKPLHFPIGGVWSKGFVGNNCEAFMGSSTVLVDKEPFSHMALPALSCQCIGIPCPPRKAEPGQIGFFLPLSLLVSIPIGNPVLIGGPPTISLTALVKKLLATGLSKLRSSQFMQNLSAKMHAAADRLMDALKISNQAVRNLVHRAICWLTGHPVDVATGKVLTESVDFELPGPIPFKWERVWYSTSAYDGPLGHGWHHNYDLAFAEDPENMVVALRMADGRPVLFHSLKVGESTFNLQEKLTLGRDEKGYYLRDKDRLNYRFAPPLHPASPVQLLQSITDDNGFSIQFEYNAQGHLTQIIDSAQRILQVSCDAQGRILSIHAPHPTQADLNFVIAQYTYDGLGNLIQVDDAHQIPFRYDYQGHLLIKETNREGLGFYFQYDGPDSSARCLRTWGDKGIYDHKLVYDLETKTTVVENSLGHRSTHYWNDMGLVYKVIDPKGNTSYTTFDEDCQIIAETNAIGAVTRKAYDARGNNCLIIAPDGAITKMTYDEQDLLVELITPVGGKWSWSYDEKGNLLEQLDPLGAQTTHHWEAGLLQEMVDPLGGKTRFDYDQSYNLSEIKAPDGEISKWAYDRLGRCVEFRDVKDNLQIQEFNLLGDVIKIKEPDGNIREYEFDKERNITRAKDQHYDVRFEYSGMNRMIARIENNTRVEFRYDREENLIAIQNEHGNVYSFVLDENGEVLEERGFDGLLRRYQRDGAGKVIQIQRPGDRFTRYAYDLASRIIKTEYYDGSIESFQYREDGALMAATNLYISVRFERDLLGRVLKEQQGGFVVESAYDLLGKRSSLQSSLGANFKIDRNNMGDVEHILAGNGWETRFRRDSMGLELEREFSGGLRSRWNRDRYGRPIRQETLVGGGNIQRTRGYTWESNDRLKKIIDSKRGVTHFQHDAVGNLASAQNPDGSTDYRQPDAIGNLFRSKDRSDRRYGPAGQLLQAGSTRYEYDAEGNLQRKTMGNGQVWQYEWNAAGMLRSVVRPDGQVVNFAYDALGRRISKAYRGKTTRWVWDNNTPLHEWVEEKLGATASASLIQQLAKQGIQQTSERILVDEPAHAPPAEALVTWLFEPDSFAPLAKFKAGQAQSIVVDHLGTPLSMHNQAGQAVWSADLNIYGEVKNLQGTQEDCPFRYPGQYEDVETGLYYNRFRYYDAEAGEYVSQDPIKIEDTLNVYSYVKIPLTIIDPLGLNSMDPAHINTSHPVKASSVFSNPRHGTVRDLSNALVANPQLADQIPPIEVTRINGKLYSANNRRLLAFQLARKQNPDIRIRTIPATPNQERKIKQRLNCGR